MNKIKHIGNGITEHTFDVEFPDEVVEYACWVGEGADLDKWHQLEQEFEMELIHLLRNN